MTVRQQFTSYKHTLRLETQCLLTHHCVLYTLPYNKQTLRRETSCLLNHRRVDLCRIRRDAAFDVTYILEVCLSSYNNHEYD
jgi:hypothetical protein